MEPTYIQPERREKPRIHCAYPAKVSGTAAGGASFEESTFINDLSASGLFLRLKTEIVPQSGLSVVFRVSKSAPLVGQGRGPLIAVEGSVVRAQVQQDGTFGVAVKIQSPRFL